MNINKNAALSNIKASSKLTAIEVSANATQQEKDRTLKLAAKELATFTRSKKTVTVVIAET